MEGFDYLIRLGETYTNLVNGDIERYHSLAILPQLTPVLRTDVLDLHAQSDLDIVTVSDVYRPVMHTEFIYADFTDEELLNTASSVAGFLIIRAAAAVDVDPCIKFYNSSTDNVLTAHNIDSTYF